MALKKVTLPGLLGFAGTAGMVIGITGLLYKRVYESKLNNSKFLEGAVNEMAKHEEIIKLLGGEYKVGLVNHRDDWSKMEKTSMRVRLPIEGTERNANLLIYAYRNDTNSNFIVNRIEMIFDKIDSRRLLVMDIPKEAPEEQKTSDTKELPDEQLMYLRKK